MEKTIICGSVESSDVLVKYEPSSSELEISVESKVIHQFGDEIFTNAKKICQENNLTTGKLSINDQGSIPAVLNARILGIVAKMKEGN